MTEFAKSNPVHEDNLRVEQLDQATIPIRNRLKHVLQPRGRKNRNAMLALLVLGAVSIAILWIFIRGSGPAQAAGPSGRMQSGSVSWVESAKDDSSSLVSAPPQSAILGPPPEDKRAAEPLPPNPVGYDRGYDAPGLGGRRQGLTPVMSSMEGGPNGDATVPSVAPRKSVFAGNPQDGFVQRFRDGDKPPIRHGDEAQSGPAAKPLGGSSEAAIALLPKGLQIAMKLLDPVATGSKSRARIRVTADALDSSGKVLVLNGTEGDLPFAAGEILGGRVILNDSEKGVLRVNGQEVPITGSIRDKDGRVGLKGEIKKSGGSGVLGRTLGAVGRTASGIAMRSGLPVYDVESAIGLPGGTGVQYGSSREVVVKKDAQFTFIVGQ